MSIAALRRRPRCCSYSSREMSPSSAARRRNRSFSRCSSMMMMRARAPRDCKPVARETDGTLREVCLWPDARGQYQPLLSHCEWGLPRRASAPGISHTWIWITEASGARAGPSGRGLPCGENGEEWTRYETTGNRLTCIQLELLGTAFHNSQHDTRFQETPRAADTGLLESRGEAALLFSDLLRRPGFTCFSFFSFRSRR